MLLVDEVASLSIRFPLGTGLGFDPIWFGLNVFVIQNLMRGTTARDVTLGTTPYVIMMILLVVLLFLAPELALWLPRHMAPGR